MDAAKYIIKVNEICCFIDNNNLCGDKCPLWEYNCGLLQPTKMNEIDVAVMVDYVESFSTETFVESNLTNKCENCGFTYGRQYNNAKFCPKCGERRIYHE